MTNAPNGSTTPTDAAGATGNAQAPAPVKMQVLAQFIRDLSFENILAQKGAQGEVKPDVKVQVNLDAKKRPGDSQYEVTTKYIVTSKNAGTDTVLFHLELDYSGVFHIEGVPDQQMHPFLMIECPRMLFPFARRIVSDVTRDGGFPPLNLENVDFVSIYRNELQRRAEAQQKKAEAEPTAAN